MAINHLTTNPLRPDTSTANVGVRGPKVPGGEQHTAQASIVNDESLTLTAAARTLSSAAREGGEAAPFDSQRVAAIRQALEEGSYAIDTRQLADNMLRLESLLA